MAKTPINPIFATLRAVSFLTRLPVGTAPFSNVADDYKAADDAAYYPLAGLLIAAPGALILLLTATLGAPTLLTALLAIATTTVLTGALHEDGLADVADGFGGGATSKRKLEIMKDSNIGTYGVLALVFTLALQAVSLQAISEHGAISAVLAFMAAHALSRAIMVGHWQRLALARSDGTASKAGQPSKGTMQIALVASIVVIMLALPMQLGLATIVALLSAACAAFFFERLCKKMIGGHTGDTIGATQQLTLNAWLCGLAIAL